MKQKHYKKIFKDTDFVHRSGTREELQVAQYLKTKCEELGLEARLEDFDVDMADIHEASLTADGKNIPCKGLFCCGSGEVEAEFYYMPGYDKVSIAGAKDKIVMVDVGGFSKFVYEDLYKAGAKALIFQYGNAYYANNDIEERDLRSYVVGDCEKLLSVMINVKDGIRLVKNNTKTVKIRIDQDEYTGKSHNVICDLPGEKDEWVVMSAHYDTTGMSHGTYDNMTGCVALLAVMDALKNRKHNYGLRLVFCGSEERGLLGSKAYVKDHKDELEKMLLNVNVDMIGSYMGPFSSLTTAEDKLMHYVSYLSSELNFPTRVKNTVNSSDCTSFADGGVPAISFGRFAMGSMAPFHCRYDSIDEISMSQMEKDIAFITCFTEKMLDAKVFPVRRFIPENLKKEMDYYLFRTRRED